MNFLSNAKIGTKVISLLVAMGIISAGIAVYASIRLKALDDTYSALITNQNGAALDIAIVNRDVTNMGYGTYMIVAHPAASAQAKVGVEMQHDGKSKASERLAEAKKLIPEKAAAIDVLQAKLTEAGRLSDIALRHGMKDEDELAKSTEVQANQAIASFITDGKTPRDELIKDVTTRSDAITAQNKQDTVLMIGGALLPPSR